MKKFIIVTPQRDERSLHRAAYDTVDTDLFYPHETRFPLVVLINSCVDRGDIEGGEEIKVMTITYEKDQCYHNLELLKEELEALAVEKGVKIDVESIEFPFDDSVGAMINIFDEFIGRVDEGDELFFDITYGSKPIPIALFAIKQFVYSNMRNVHCERVIYGQRDWDMDRMRIYDVTALFDLIDILQVIPKTGLSDPVGYIRRLIEG